MNKVKIRSIENELYYNENIIAQYVIEYPELIETPYKASKQVFNSYYINKVLNLKQIVENKLYNKAKKSKFIVYKLISECNIVHNCKNCLIVYFSYYTLPNQLHNLKNTEEVTWKLRI